MSKYTCINSFYQILKSSITLTISVCRAIHLSHRDTNILLHIWEILPANYTENTWSVWGFKKPKLT